MRLKCARVTNFKSIDDSGLVEFEPDVTCLVGKNESGKTAFLEALYRLRPITLTVETNFNGLDDYPRRRWASEKGEAPQLRPVEATFALDDSEVKALEERFGPRVLPRAEVTLSKSYANVPSWSFEIDESAYVRHVVAVEKLDNSLADSCSTVAELVGKLTAADPESSATPVGGKLKGFDLRAQLQQALERLVPKFLYFSEYSQLPGRFSVAYVQGRSEQQLDAQHRTALSFLRLAAVGPGDLPQDQYEARKAVLEAAAASVTQEVFEFWTQNKDLVVQVDWDLPPAKPPQPGQPAPPTQETPPFLDIRIFNPKHSVSINFSRRSTGFVWFFSFLVAFSEFRKTDHPLVLLLDEPGLGLHAAAQGDLLRLIDQRLAGRHQVVYTTHSPFMINPRALNRVRTVEDVEGKGTKISADILTTQPDTVFPLQGALGYELGQTLMIKPDNLIVEGPADMVYLNVLSDALRQKGRTHLDPRWALVPAGGIGKVPAFVALFGSQLNVAVIFDVAAGGSQKLSDLVRRGLLKKSNLIPLAEITNTREADIEDLFDFEFYLELLKLSGVADLTAEPLPSHPRIVARVEQALGQGYDHFQPASYLLKEQANLLPKASDQSWDRFEALFRKINDALS
jgi:energy-coupling factor transporter ATP-binding protein EcfA2